MGGAATVLSAVIGSVAKVNSDDRRDIWNHVNDIKKTYVRGDDLDELKAEVLRLRDATHDLSGAIQTLQGKLDGAGVFRPRHGED